MAAGGAWQRDRGLPDRADRHRPDEREPPRAHRVRSRGRSGAGERGAEDRLRRREQPLDRRRPRRLRARGPLLPRARAAHRRPAARTATLAVDRPADGLVHARCSRTSPRPSRAIRSPAAASSRRAWRCARSRGCTRRVFADPQLGATPWLNQENAAQPGADDAAAARLPRALRRARRRRAPGGVSALHREPRRLGSATGGRRSAWCTATTASTTCCSATSEAPRPFAVVDWQTVGWGPAMTDVAYFLGGSLAVEDRRAHEQALRARVPRRAARTRRPRLRLGELLGRVPAPEHSSGS